MHRLTTDFTLDIAPFQNDLGVQVKQLHSIEPPAGENLFSGYSETLPSSAQDFFDVTLAYEESTFEFIDVTLALEESALGLL